MIKIKKGKNTITNDVAYIAGFFDGEGCIRIKRSSQGGNSYHIIAHITNSNLEILEYVKNIFGGKIRKQERTPNKTIYNFYITCSEANDMLKVLVGFMREKKKQAELAIKFHQIKEKLSPEKKEEYYIKISELKRL